MNFNGEDSELDGTDLSGGGTISGDLGIIGDLDVSGTITADIIEANTIVSDLVLEDPLIEMGISNPSDLLNLGSFGKYDSGGARYAGLIRSHVNSKWYLSNNDIVKPTATGALTNASGTLKLAVVEAGQLQINDYTFPLTDGTANQILQTDGAGSLTFETQTTPNIFDQSLNKADSVQFSNLSFDKPGSAAIREINFKLMESNQLTIRHTDGKLIVRSASTPIIKFDSATNKVIIGSDNYSFPLAIGTPSQVLTVPVSGTDLEFKDLPADPTYDTIKTNQTVFTADDEVPSKKYVDDEINGLGINQDVSSGGSPAFEGIQLGIPPNWYVFPTARATVNDQILVFKTATNSLVFENPAELSSFIELSGAATVDNILTFNATGDAISSGITVSGSTIGDVNALQDTASNTYLSSNGSSTVVENVNDIRLKIGGNIKQFINAAGTEMYKPIQLITSTQDNEIIFGSVPSYHVLSKMADDNLYIEQVNGGVPKTAMKFSDSPTDRIDLEFDTYVNNQLTVSDTNGVLNVIGTGGDAVLTLDKKLPTDLADIIFSESGNIRHVIELAGSETKIRGPTNDLLIFDGDSVRTGVPTSFTTADLRITDTFAPASFHLIHHNAGFLELTDLTQDPIVRVGTDKVEIRRPVEADYGVCQYKQFFGINLCTPAQMYYGYGNVATASQLYTSLLTHGTTMGTLTIPANSLASSSHLKFKCGGYIYNNNENFDIQIKLQGVVVGSILNHNPEGQTTNNGFELECDIGFKVIGTAYECITVGELTYATTTNNKDTYEGKAIFNLNPITGLNAATSSLFEVVFKWQGTGGNIVNQLSELQFSSMRYS